MLHSILTAAFGAALCVQTSPDSNPPRFAIVTIPGLGGEFTSARGINSVGHVTGGAYLSNNATHRAYIYRDGAMTELPLLAEGRDALGRAINDLDEVAGETYLTNGRLVTATLWDAQGRVRDLDTWQTHYSKAWAINDAGEVAGDANDPLVNELRRAILWKDGQMISLGVLPLPGHDRSTANDINEVGEIVGLSSGDVSRAFLWRNGDMEELEWADGETTNAQGMNDQGQIVGSADFERKAVLWNNGIPQTLRLRPNDRYNIEPFHVNNAGHIVGHVQRSPGGNNIYVFWPSAQAPYTEVQDLLPPQSLWRRIETVDDLNDSAQMVGHGKRGADSGFGVGHAFLLTPVNWTFTLEAPSPGIAGVSNTLRITGVTPGATVGFYYSIHGGGAVIPGCTIQQNALQLESPTLIGTAIADGNGTATITRTVPLIAQNRSILFQAVVQQECAISQLVVHQFE
ncbi:MAG: hypothetical protein IT430_02255 [Phycisphaerales bacterium]|nr:hypothetical protein [Phycisphaerales bacterium]